MTIKKDTIFIYPTDTVWGIGCSLYSLEGFNKLAEIKKTTNEKPLSIMFPNIGEVYKSFHFQKKITLPWLREFFSLETSLGIPAHHSKIPIPDWVLEKSSIVSIRCLESEIIQTIFSEINGPFFTTSLNLTGQPPIITKQEALNFKNTYADKASFFSINGDEELSGEASTVIFMNDELEFEIKREGKKYKEVAIHLDKLEV